MPKKQKQHREVGEDAPSSEGATHDDQKGRPYYYDDSHGYEAYRPENDCDDTTENEQIEE